MNGTSNERLSELTKDIASAGGIGDDEAERISSSPFLYARVRARIEAEHGSRAEQGTGWLGSLLIATRAIAVLLMVTIAAAAAFWSSRTDAPEPPAARSTADDVARVVTGGTCALSATDECAISNEEVLATLFAEEGGKEQK